MIGIQLIVDLFHPIKFQFDRRKKKTVNVNVKQRNEFDVSFHLSLLNIDRISIISFLIQMSFEK